MQLIEGVRIEPEVYDLADINDSAVRSTPFVAAVPVLSHFLDLPLLRGDETPHAPYVAASAQKWPGAVAVYQSSTDSDYALNKLISSRSTVGVTQTAMAAARAGVIDTGDALEVELVSGTLSSVSLDGLLSGSNLAAIGDGSADKWEVFQFGEAEIVAPKTYALKKRLRGQAGSDALMPATWPAGSRFVLLDGGPSQIAFSPHMRGVTQNFRIGPAQQSVNDPSHRHSEMTFAGNGLRPCSPVHLRADLTGGGDYEISWIRRTRTDGDGWDTPEVPLGEESESYLLRIFKDSAVVREELISSAGWTYTTAMQASDAVAAPFAITVAQVSASFGPGLSASMTVAS